MLITLFAPGAALSWPEAVSTSLILVTKAQTLLPCSPRGHSTGVMVHDSLVHDALVPTDHQLNVRILGKK